MSETKTVHVRIEGRVQGVWYRAWTVGEARKLGLSGWVRNRSDGSVEALFQGSSAAVDAMLAACREGPPAARVSAVTVNPAEAYDGTDFEQRATV
ncbi:acylphosphatase [Telmatospirillum sp. J64-1]|uniref:acylphosphatase n=1 Tax=Telmatospirillum sp. J64-1 TaxID=2502183 RepID=UPI00115C5D62|nr:acylphosphatase [Telmatospirillum sp. J64-1]